MPKKTEMTGMSASIATEITIRTLTVNPGTA
jgi:hypothetical protein